MILTRGLRDDIRWFFYYYILMKPIKLCLVASTGGPLDQTYLLKGWWQNYNRFWVTFKKEHALSLLKDERVYFAYFPEHRNPINAIKNTVLALKILLQERPKIIFSPGAGIAPPFFFIGKLLGCKLIYLESAAFVNKPSLTGRLVYPLADKFLIQYKNLKRFYPKADYWGGIL